MDSDGNPIPNLPWSTAFPVDEDVNLRYDFDEPELEGSDE